MSGGRFDYRDGNLANEIFGWKVSVEYDLADESLEKSRKFVRKQNVFEDKEISEMIYDMFCLIHSYDWAVSGDTGREDYRKDVKYFKNKWLGRTDEERIRSEIEKCLEEAKENLLETFGLKEE